MIKQIQLRGISRSPSDRMSQDGGLDESLNLYIDSAENAPALMPEDVTASLGLPDDLQADKVFVHKAANYENVITIEDGILKAFDKNASLISTFSIAGRVNDVVSLGNTLLVLTDSSTNYILFKGGQYVNLGTDIPFPKLHVQANGAGGQKSVTIDLDEIGVPGMYRSFSSAEYGSYLNNGQNSDENVQKILSVIGDQKAVIAGELGRQGLFWGPVYVMYGITLYNGTVITTVPELVLRKTNTLPRVWGLTLESKFEMNGLNKEFIGDIEAKIDAPAFSLDVSCEEDYDIADWKDLIHSVDVYATLPIDTAPDYRRIEVTDVSDTNSTTSSTQTRTASVNWGILDERAQILGTGNFFRIKSYELLRDDENGVVSKLYFNWDSRDFDVTGEALSTSPYQLPSSEVDHIFVEALSVAAKSGILFNEHVLLTSAVNLVTYRGSVATAMGSSNLRYTARLKFTLSDGGVVYSKSDIQLPSSGILTFANTKAVSVEMAIRRDRKIYTDQDGTDYDIETTYSYLALPMKPHLSMPCSYAYIGIGESFEEYAFEKNGVLTIEELQDKIDFNTAAPHYLSLKNKVLVSSASNPFVYPETKRITFQSRVLGVAIATTALSQGQFGQFPLYVFTEDGVWAMETAADGSFVTSKPLSRDVCINPDSITSIDNAVIFVTAKGVMLLQGSQVANISPFMNGRHYAINESSRERIRRTEFADLIPVLEDSTPFMGFMKDASVAYDYQGKRLVFIKKDERYQYVYHMDTQTWHKTAYGTDLLAPINSYPDCCVQGRELRHTILLYVEDAGDGSEKSYKEFVKAVRDNDIPLSSDDIYDMFYKGRNMTIDLLVTPEEQVQSFIKDAEENAQVSVTYDDIENVDRTRIYDLSTVLDGTREQETARGCIITRPMDFGYADVRKVINGIRIRGQYAKGAVSFMLLGSDDGETYHVLNSLRGRSWKLFRIIMLADLDRHERISWIDIDFETRFTNRLR